MNYQGHNKAPDNYPSLVKSGFLIFTIIFLHLECKSHSNYCKQFGNTYSDIISSSLERSIEFEYNQEDNENKG
jgi:hypothetical protein